MVRHIAAYPGGFGQGSEDIRYSQSFSYYFEHHGHCRLFTVVR